MNCLILFTALFSSYSLVLYAQLPTREQLIGTWVGVHTELSPESFCPLPIYLKLDADNTYHLGMVDGSAAQKVSTWSASNDQIKLDTIRYAPDLITLRSDLLRIGKVYPMTFRRFQDIPIDSAQVYHQLVGRVWQSDSLIMYLYANNKIALEHPLTKQRTIHFWRLVRFGQSVFLVIQGNQYTIDGSYKTLRQVSNSSTKQIQMVGWNGHEIATRTFRWVNNLLVNDSCKASAFQPCDNCSQPLLGGFTVGRESHELMSLFTKFYQPAYQSNQSGLLRIRFTINCMGEQGDFDIRGFDEAYCPKTYANQLIRQLVTICRTHATAIASYSDSNNVDNQGRDVFVSITFRLKNGQLIAILP